MTTGKSASSPEEDALLRKFERLEREIASQFRDNPELAATPVLRLKLIALLDDMAWVADDLRRERDALKREIEGLDGAMAATDAYRMGSRLGQTKQGA